MVNTPRLGSATGPLVDQGSPWRARERQSRLADEAASQAGEGLESQPPWDLLALLALAFIVFGWMALAVSYNPSQGAQSAFVRIHAVVVQQFQTLPWDAFLQQMRTTCGPVFYALVGSLHLPTEGVRAVGLVMHLVSTLLLLQVALRFGTPWKRAAVLSVAFFASPFQFGPALWGHPDVLATLLMMLGLGSTLLATRSHRLVAAGLLPLTVVVQQAGVAVVAASCLADLRARRYADMAIKALGTALMLYLLYRVWDGFTSPAVQRTWHFNIRAFLVAWTLLVLGLHACDRLNARTEWPVLLGRFLVLWPVLTGLYALSAPLTGGGFIFSRLDMLEAPLWPISMISPALMAAVMSWSWNSLKWHRLSDVQILLCAAMLATGTAVYLKDVDFFFWPLLLMRLLRWGRKRPGMRDALVRSATIWTLVSLTLATVSYRLG